MQTMEQPFLLYDDTYELIYSRLVMANLDPHISFRVIEVHPLRMSYLCEVQSKDTTWWQWVSLHRGNSRKMYTKPKVRHKKVPALT
ncbi:hypothetical protein PJK55_00595 [Exiguobacterium sp. MMG028]|uniref:hypothetical protein n=1 Tax=Exiguobacterium sp. MMG028 TaxID=3021979 RepID=UPI0022FE33E5|nr:hypothetical protein [Exiguobacterium sp. MMG028]MDA5559214.1 hypothetical protein [Exiguobacterium sp. MMG028]